jgi:hypothetical protein
MIVDKLQIGKLQQDLEPDLDYGPDPAIVPELRRVRRLFDECRTNQLFHCTRVLVRPDLEKANDESANWEALSDQPTFHHSTFRLDYPAPRVQHLCFYGSRELVSQFTGLAQQVSLIVPSAFLPRISFNPDHWEARSLRDQWMLGLYRLAYMRRALLPITRDLQRNGAGTFDGVDRGFFDPLSRAGCCDEKERSGYEAWLTTFDLRNGASPQYVYSSLALNVWESTLIAIDYIVGNLDSLFKRGPQFVFWEDIDKVRPFTQRASETDGAPEGNGKFLEVDFDANNGVATRHGFAGKVSLSPVLRKLFGLLLNARGTIVACDRLSSAWGTSKSQNGVRIYQAVSRLNNKIARLNLLAKNDRALGYKLIGKSFAIKNGGKSPASGR